MARVGGRDVRSEPLERAVLAEVVHGGDVPRVCRRFGVGSVDERGAFLLGEHPAIIARGASGRPLGVTGTLRAVMDRSEPSPRPEHADDPVRRRRRQFARWTLLANRVGYLVLALAMALFVIAFAVGFSSVMAGLVIACLIVSFVLLAPSIVLGYAVKAAERDDVEHGR
jgi:small-conductance mechanosensitive channel